jgi:glutamyl-tRNA synthetase
MLRFATSPAGELSINAMRIALINYIVSRQRGERYIVRIEESIQAADSEGKDQETLDLLKKFAIEQDQLLYQSDNLGRHQQFALSLVGQDKAFACICSAEGCRCLDDQKSIAAQIKAENLPYVIRIKKPKTPITFTDKIKGEIQTDPDEIGSFVILSAEGSPTYDFACACDDMLADISLVIRTEEHIDHTPQQIHIKHSLGYTVETAYAHLPALLHTADEDSDSIKWLLTEGFLPDAIINYLLLLGNETPTEIFTLPEAIEWFELEKLSSHPAPFDIDMLRQINRKHLEAMGEKALSRLFGFADADIGKLLKLYLTEATTLNALESRIKMIFSPKPCSGEQAEQMQILSALILESPMLDSFDSFTQYLSDQSKLEEKALLKALRVLMTGAQSWPELGDIYPLVNRYFTEIARCTS